MYHLRDDIRSLFRGRELIRRLRLSVVLYALLHCASSGVSDGFGSADDVHLGEDAFHMRLDGALTNKESRADLFVAFALGHQLEHIDLAFAQVLAGVFARHAPRAVVRLPFCDTQQSNCSSTRSPQDRTDRRI